MFPRRLNIMNTISLHFTKITLKIDATKRIPKEGGIKPYLDCTTCHDFLPQWYFPKPIHSR